MTRELVIKGGYVVTVHPEIADLPGGLAAAPRPR
jgi:hypothetical protein